MKTASVVITTKNRKEELLKAVESAMAQRGLLEVIVIDDGSTDDTARFIERIAAENGWQAATQPMSDDESLRTDSQNPNQQSLNIALSAISYPPANMAKPQLRLIRHEVSAGYIIRRNEGARVAKGDVIFSLDDDAVFSSPFVVEQTLRDFSHPRIGAVAIPYIEPHKANKEMQRAPTREDVWITASYIGTAHALRRDVFLALGGYREHLVHQGEEGDFCLRMLATEQPRTDSGGRRTEGKAEHPRDSAEPKGETNVWPREGNRSVAEQSGNAEKLKRERTTDDSDKHGWGTTKDTNLHERGYAGGRLAGQACASESDSLASELADSPVSESLISSADDPASALDSGRGRQWNAEHIPTGSALDAAPLSAVPGFFVRLGNSDVIIHNESPKRDYSRMDFYGRRNDVLFHWQNTPMPDLLWQLPKTIAGGLACAAKVGRWRKMLEGIGAGFLAIAGGVRREPVLKKVVGLHKDLKRGAMKMR